MSLAKKQQTLIERKDEMLKRYKKPISRLGWHFLKDDGKLRYEDNRKPKKGVTLAAKPRTSRLFLRLTKTGTSLYKRVALEPSLCSHGMHASPTILDALVYAPGTMLTRVRVDGVTKANETKFVGTHRTILEGPIDAAPILRKVLSEIVNSLPPENREARLKTFGLAVLRDTFNLRSALRKEYLRQELDLCCIHHKKAYFRALERKLTTLVRNEFKKGNE